MVKPVACAAVLCASLSSGLTGQAATIRVPADYPTIQQAITAAGDHDEVLVEPGVYLERIDFLGKRIAVRSTAGAGTTIIDGQQGGSVVTFKSGESRETSLDGFSIVNGGGWVEGGGIHCDASGPTVIDCAIAQNVTFLHGGGVVCNSASAPLFLHCRIIANRTTYTGGGVGSTRSSPVFLRCLIADNVADNGAAGGDGGGLDVYSSSSALLVNCMIVNNSSRDRAGACYVTFSSTATFVNCTIANNASRSGGGGVYSWENAQAKITNGVLWGNSPDQLGSSSGGSLSVTYSDVAGGWSGQGNVDADPRFLEPRDGNFHLRLDSPCVDIGTSADPNVPSDDFDGNPRSDGLVDIGADEAGAVGMPLPSINRALPGIGGTIRVPKDYTTIQQAIDASSNGDEIVVSAGTYLERIDFHGKDILVHSTDGASVTTINGSQGGSVVTFASGEPQTAELRGFTITGGKAPRGGGIYCSDASPSIEDCRIVANEAWSSLECGGGIYCAYSSARIVNNAVDANHAADWGGGIICSRQCFALIEANTITNNTTPWAGGGIYCWEESAPIIRRNLIAYNTGANGAGGIWSNASSPLIDSNVITGNSAGGAGGLGVEQTHGVEQIVITNNIIAWNTVSTTGGGIVLNGNMTLTNNVFFGNTAQSAAAIYSVNGGTFTNCVVWGHQGTAINGPATITYSDVQGGWPGAGNIDADPLFADAAGGDFHLLANSPCIDAGDNAAPSLPATDFEGDARIIGPAVDVGADEALQDPTCKVVFAPFGQGLAGSWEFVPALNGGGGACDLGGSFLRIEQGLGGAAGLLWVGIAQADYPFFGGRFYIDLGATHLAVPIKLGGSVGWPGTGELDLPTPDLTPYAGLVVYLQASMLDAGAVQGVSLTNGLQVSVALE